MGLLKNNIIFYDRNGLRQPAIYNSINETWNYELSFEYVSVGLFSTQQIHIFESVINNASGGSTITPPKTTSGQKFKFKFKNSNYKNFFLYAIDYSSTINDYYVSVVTNNSSGVDLQLNEYEEDYLQSSEDNSVINNLDLNKGEIYTNLQKIKEHLTYSLDSTTELVNVGDLVNTTQSFINGDGKRVILNYSDVIDSITVNIGFNSDLGGEFTEILQIYVTDSNGDNETLFAEISLFAEAVEEDFRLTNLLENFGESLDSLDSLVFRDTNVNEDKIDHVVLNKKKKELLLEYKNLIPFIGSYKGLINALKFYGYGDLKLKEWWLNLSTDKYSHFEIDNKTYKTIKTKSDSFGNNSMMKRTGKFSLFYDIFKLTGNFDQYGIPILEKTFEYSQDEVLIKLYGLKTVLKNKFLPLNTRIIDITGEGIVFDRYSTSISLNPLTVLNNNSVDDNFNVTVKPIISYIDKYDMSGYNPNVNNYSLNTLTTTELSNIATYKLDSFDDVYMTTKYDYPDRKGYANIQITNNTFYWTWGDANAPWSDYDDIDWDFINSYPYYELTWDVYTNGWFQRYSGNVNNFSTINVHTNKTGDYDVILKAKDVYNNLVVKRFPKLFRVELPEPNFSVVYHQPNYATDWNSISTKKWRELSSVDWGDSVYVNDYTWDNADVNWESLDTNSYPNDGLLNGQYRVQPKSFDRNLQTVTFDKSKFYSISDVSKQKYLTLVHDKIYPFIEPVIINSVDLDNDTIVVTTNSTIYDNDFIEVYNSYTTDNITWTYTTKELIIDVSIGNAGYIKVFIKTSDGDKFILPIKSFYNNPIRNTSTMNIIDSDDVLYNKTISSVTIINEPQTLEVVSSKKIGNDLHIKVRSDVELNLDYINLILPIYEFSCWWNLVGGKYSIPILKVVESMDDIIVHLNDNEDELFRTTPNFDCIFAPYDVNYAENRTFVKEIKWNQTDSVLWEDLENTLWDSTEWYPSLLTGFTIEKFTDGGTIQVGDGEIFQFESCNANVDVAISQLTNSNVDELSMYNFYRANANVIHAVSKTYGFDTLHIIKHTGDVKIKPQINPMYSVNYPILPVTKQEPNFKFGSKNNRMNHKIPIRIWDYYGEYYDIPEELADPDKYEKDDLLKNFQNHLGYGINGNLRWNSVKSTSDSVVLNKGVICGFVPDLSTSIIGKTKYTWQIIRDSDDEVLVEVISEKFTFYFDEEGTYSVKLTVSDNNGNEESFTKFSFIIIK